MIETFGFSLNLRILIFSGLDEDIYAIRYINAGGNGCLSEISNREQFLEAIETVMLTGKYLSKNIQDKIMDYYILKAQTNPLKLLTNRELELATLFFEGLTVDAVCETSSLKKNTVISYKYRIFKKLNTSSLIEFMKLFKQHTLHKN